MQLSDSQESSHINVTNVKVDTESMPDSNHISENTSNEIKQSKQHATTIRTRAIDARAL